MSIKEKLEIKLPTQFCVTQKRGETETAVRVSCPAGYVECVYSNQLIDQSSDIVFEFIQKDIEAVLKNRGLI